MQYLGPSFDLKTLMKTSKVSEHTQQHLSKVYTSLMATVFAAFVGASMCMRMEEFPPSVAAMGAFGGLFVMIAMSCIDKSKTSLRTALMIGFGFLEGVSLTPLLKLAVVVDERIIATAFLGTASIFLCFSLAALTSKRRSFLYLGGILGSTLTILILSSLINMFLGSALLFNLELYVGLAVFVGYILFDTQVIIEAAEKGNDDYVWHAMKLFIDLVGIFIRILIILIKMNQKKQSSSNRSSSFESVV
mmetsp:Transcript_24424/g.58876  ORF Transcript_24424/g.58876 Transcript_24424/m.58876 type:complete len:247 (+) Transcript_24424:255-995(+)|eukprot:CAMPEP_0114498376 /NCGR_PEP_ID=MMETSP0109-20121206/6843_1 /TAXON_ID=29199 /ORGANISM="Chlorarachnion reptans, Strain CCCM449" /LENGTH=246 /DNA_ID=CAMNT_0001675857 /DNA_START=255 /DNA_END=995 /DNA_ORIENTATION=+